LVLSVFGGDAVFPVLGSGTPTCWHHRRASRQPQKFLSRWWQRNVEVRFRSRRRGSVRRRLHAHG
jgi:hypothetical protein